MHAMTVSAFAAVILEGAFDNCRQQAHPRFSLRVPAYALLYLECLCAWAEAPASMRVWFVKCMCDLWAASLPLVIVSLLLKAMTRKECLDGVTNQTLPKNKALIWGAGETDSVWTTCTHRRHHTEAC